MFGEKLLLLRKSRNLTRDQLASILGVSSNTVKSYETNRTEPGHEMTKKIAAYFGVTTDFLIAQEEVYEDEKIILGIASSLKPEDRKRVIEIMKTFKQ